jgi:hypothetical protein
MWALAIGGSAAFLFILNSSSVQPYEPSRLVIQASYVAFAMAISAFIYIVFFAKRDGVSAWQMEWWSHNSLYAKCKEIGVLALGVPVCSAVLAWSVQVLPSWPTYWLASTPFRIEGDIVEVKQHGKRYRQLLKVTLRERSSDQTHRFPWSRPHMENLRLGPGHSAIIVGRTWLLGKSVDQVIVSQR